MSSKPKPPDKPPRRKSPKVFVRMTCNDKTAHGKNPTTQTFKGRYDKVVNLLQQSGWRVRSRGSRVVGSRSPHINLQGRCPVCAISDMLVNNPKSMTDMFQRQQEEMSMKSLIQMLMTMHEFWNNYEKA